MTSDSAQATSDGEQQRGSRAPCVASSSRPRGRSPAAADAPCARRRAASRCARADCARLSRADGRIARPTQRERRAGQRRGRDRAAARARGSPPNGCDARGEEALDDAVLERMEADHGEPAAGRQQRHDARQRQRELRELPIDENPKSLERPRGRILTPITPRARADGFGHDRGQLPRADDGCDRASRNNCSCNRLSKPFFTIVAYHLRQFARRRRARGTRRRIRRASDPSACRAGRRRGTRSRAPGRRSAARKCRGRAARRRRASMPSAASAVGQLREPGAAESEARIVDRARGALRRRDRGRARRGARAAPSAREDARARGRRGRTSRRRRCRRA